MEPARRLHPPPSARRGPFSSGGSEMVFDGVAPKRGELRLVEGEGFWGMGRRRNLPGAAGAEMPRPSGRGASGSALFGEGATPGGLESRG